MYSWKAHVTKETHEQTSTQWDMRTASPLGVPTAARSRVAQAGSLGALPCVISAFLPPLKHPALLPIVRNKRI